MDTVAQRTTYTGSGTVNDPYIVGWDLNDPENPYNWPKFKKWVITAQLAVCTWTVSFSSSSYTGGLQYIMHDLNISYNVAIVGISLYVLGFALGPLAFAPTSEMFGRRIIFLITISIYTVFQLEGALSHNLPTLLSCRLITGICGASPFTNGGGVISDIWNARERGLASAIYATVPFLGPGPIVGGFVAQNPHLGWHFNFWLVVIFSVFTLASGYFLTPETYAPILLRRRARSYTAASNDMIQYVSIHDLNQSKPFSQVMRTNLSRPFLFLVTEPIVLLLAIYVSIVYGTLYALFSAFPMVFQEHRHFSPGEGGLAFLGVGLGILGGLVSQPIQNKFYWKMMDKSESGRAPPEARLPLAMVGAILNPLGLWWFAWTTKPSIHWIVPILAGIPFGMGVAQILQSLTTYLMDTYTIYVASALAATIVLRSICGAVFPLFCPALFKALGDERAMTKYGLWIRNRSKFAYKDSQSSLSGRNTALSLLEGRPMNEMPPYHLPVTKGGCLQHKSLTTENEDKEL
ncbi:MFS general substrate transporter [Phlegmacium glaucopus]|nr:MFS general substrate transporter [Phlegmacium glaucopus]